MTRTLAKELGQINRRIMILRKTHNIRQSEMAEQIGISQTNLSDIERGRTAATLNNLLKIRAVLGCKMSDFFIDIDGVDESAERFNEDDIEKVVQLLKIIKGLR